MFLALYAIPAWNGFATLGIEFFTYLGYDATTAGYLASIFPGPGTAEGILQNIATTYLSYKLDPHFEFNKIAFILDLHPSHILLVTYGKLFIMPLLK